MCVVGERTREMASEQVQAGEHNRELQCYEVMSCESRGVDVRWRRIWGRIGAIDDMCVGLVGHETRLGDFTLDCFHMR